MQSIYKSRFIDVALIVSSLYSIYFIFHKFSGGKVPFWDFHVYYCGAEYYLKGLVPYGDTSLGILKDCLNPNILLPVNNSPLALEILKFLALINFSNAKFIWVILEFFSILIIYYVFGKIFFKQILDYKYFLLFIFSFSGITFVNFWGGNISIILYGILSLGIYALVKKNSSIFFFVIFFISIIKFYLLVFLLIPFLMDSKKYSYRIFLTILVYFLISYIFAKYNPEITKIYFNEVFVNLNDVVRKDPGTGTFSIIEKMPNIIYSFFNDGNLEFSFKTNIIFWLVFLSFFIIPIFIILNSKKYKNNIALITEKRKDVRMKLSIAMGILIAMLAIPRLVSYDLIICLPVIFYLITRLNINKNKVIFFDVKNILFLSILIIHDHHYPFFMVTLLIIFFIYSEFYKKNLFKH